MRTRSAGYVLLYPLCFLTLFGMMLAVFLPRYTAWYHQAVVTCEAERLVGELRLLRQASRLSLMRYETGDRFYLRPEFCYNEGERRYWMAIYRLSNGNRLLASEVRPHQLPPGVSMQMLNSGQTTKLNRLTFGFNGGTSAPTTFLLTYGGDGGPGKKIVINAVGRIRVEER